MISAGILKQTFFTGNVVNIQTGEWKNVISGLGAGLDSFYEYLLKAFVLFGVEADLKMFQVVRLLHFMKVFNKALCLKQI